MGRGLEWEVQEQPREAVELGALVLFENISENWKRSLEGPGRATLETH